MAIISFKHRYGTFFVIILVHLSEDGTFLTSFLVLWTSQENNFEGMEEFRVNCVTVIGLNTACFVLKWAVFFSKINALSQQNLGVVCYKPLLSGSQDTAQWVSDRD